MVPPAAAPSAGRETTERATTAISLLILSLPSVPIPGQYTSGAITPRRARRRWLTKILRAWSSSNRASGGAWRCPERVHRHRFRGAADQTTIPGARLYAGHQLPDRRHVERFNPRRGQVG